MSLINIDSGLKERTKIFWCANANHANPKGRYASIGDLLLHPRKESSKIEYNN
jgi:hypothetical protein